MMWTTCFAAKCALRRDRVDERDGALDRDLVFDADLLAQLAVQRVDEAFARVDPASRQEPVLAAPRLLVAAEQDPVLPAQQRRDADAGLERQSDGRRAEAAHAALAVGQLPDLDRIDAGDQLTTSCAIRIPGSTTKVSRASVFSR